MHLPPRPPQRRHPSRRSAHPSTWSAASTTPSTPRIDRGADVTHVGDPEGAPGEIEEPDAERDAHPVAADLRQAGGVDRAGRGSSSPSRRGARVATNSDSPSGAAQASTAARTAPASTAWRCHRCSSPSSSIIRSASRNPNKCDDRRRAAEAEVLRPFLQPERPVPVARAHVGACGGPPAPAAPAHTNPSPGGVISPFCEAARVTSTPHSSISYCSHAHRGDAVDHQQRRMVGGVERPADGGNVVASRRGGVGLHHQHRLDRRRSLSARSRASTASGSIAAPSSAIIISTSQPVELGHLGPRLRRTHRTRAPARGRRATACSTAPSPTRHGRC